MPSSLRGHHHISVTDRSIVLGALGFVFLIVSCGREGPRAGAVDLCEVTPVVASARIDALVPDTARVKFAEVTRADVRPNGDLVVLDGTGPVLFRVDTLGRTTVLVDRRGTGPGELADPKAFAFDSRGHLWVASPNPPRIAEFDSTGKYIRTWSYWRAAMVSDLAFDGRDRLHASYRMLSAPDRLKDGSTFALVERLSLGDSVTSEPLDSLTRSTVIAAPFFSSPLIDVSLASSPAGDVVGTPALAYELRWYAGDAQRRVTGCQDGVDNEESLRKSTILEGGFTLLSHDIAFAPAPDGSLYHLTASIRKDGHQRLDRFDAQGRLLSAQLVQSVGAGGVYLSALLPTPDASFFWGYDVGGMLYAVRLGK